MPPQGRTHAEERNAKTNHRTESANDESRRTGIRTKETHAWRYRGNDEPTTRNINQESCSSDSEAEPKRHDKTEVREHIDKEDMVFTIFAGYQEDDPKEWLIHAPRTTFELFIRMFRAWLAFVVQYEHKLTDSPCDTKSKTQNTSWTRQIKARLFQIIHMQA